MELVNLIEDNIIQDNILDRSNENLVDEKIEYINIEDLDTEINNIENNKKIINTKIFKDTYNPLYDDDQIRVLDLINAKNLEEKKIYLDEISENISKLDSKKPLTENEQVLYKNLINKYRHCRKKIAEPHLKKFTGEASAVAKKVANLLIRAHTNLNEIKYELIYLDDIGEEAYEFGFLDPSIKFGKTFCSIAEINASFKIFIDCNKCINLDDFENFCKSNNLNGAKRDYFLTTKQNELNKRSLSKSSLVSNQTIEDEIITKYFNIKLKIWIKKNGIDYVDSMIINLEKILNKKGESMYSKRSFLMYKSLLEPRNRNFLFYGEKSKPKNDSEDTLSTTLKDVPLWMPKTLVRSMNKKYNS